jgi:tetratricopeptide (TPR) repeat protein
MKSLLIRVFLIIIIPGFGSGNLVFCQDQVAIDSLQQIIGTTKSDSVEVYLNVAIARTYSKSDVIMSLQYGEKALLIAEESKDSTLISYALFNLGVRYFSQGVMNLSIPYFFRYLEISQEQKDNKAIAYAMANIGAIYLNIKELDKASDYFEQALATFEIIYADSDKPRKEAISIYNNLGIIAKERHKYETAIDYYKMGISLARVTPGVNTQLANLLNNMGSLYIESGKPDKATVLLMEALQIRTSDNDMPGIVKSYLSLANYYQAQNLDDKALEHLYMALDLAKKVGIKSSMAEAQRLLFETYQEKQLADSALKYHILFTDMSENMHKESALKELKHLEITSHFRENERLKQIEQKRKEQRYQFIGLTLVLAIFILSLLIFLVFIRSRRLKLEKGNIILKTKNIELEKGHLENQLEARNKELATNVMYQIQRNELINTIVEKLQKQSSPEAKKYPAWVLEIISDLKKTQKDSVWDEFELRFMQVHNEFYNKLNEINPGLSPNERRLCAFLRLNMTTKEISSITGQSYRSIEVARTRLRKKLNLTNSETGLVEFLSTL